MSKLDSKNLRWNDETHILVWEALSYNGVGNCAFICGTMDPENYRDVPHDTSIFFTQPHSPDIKPIESWWNLLGYKIRGKWKGKRCIKNSRIIL